MEVPFYELPDERIAQTPIEPRDSAKLLDASVAGQVSHRVMTELVDLVGPGDVIVLNSSKVIPARFNLTKSTGGAAEILLLDPMPGGGAQEWRALVRPGKRLPPGTPLYAGRRLVAVVGDRLEDGVRRVRLIDEDAQPDPNRYSAAASLALETGAAEMPLPPYIHQPLVDQDRYQTVYADVPGSVAAPTAGLHLTPSLLAGLAARGADIQFLDLAVGLGTFRPVTATKAEEHEMHAEHYSVPPQVMEAVERAERVIAVGTTTTRALETAAATGQLEGDSHLYIHGDFPWKVVDLLVTNFHQPRSTLLLLLEAFCGPGWRDLYRQALEGDYRFLSFGDAMVVARGWSQP